MAEEDALEGRRRRAASFTDEHSSQPSVPQGGPPYTPDSAQELYPSSDPSGLKFSEQQTEESPQPYPPGGVGPVKVKEQLDNAVEEHGAGAEGGMCRGSEHRTHNTASVCECFGVVVLSRYTLHVFGVLSNLTVSEAKCVFCGA